MPDECLSDLFSPFSVLLVSLKEEARMVGERDREQEEVCWELDDTAVTSIPPPFNNGVLPYSKAQQQKHQQQQQQQAFADAADGDAQGRWYDEKDFGLMGGEGMGGGQAANTAERGVRFPEATSPTNGFYNSQLSQAPLQNTHSRYAHKRHCKVPFNRHLSLNRQQIDVITST